MKSWIVRFVSLYVFNVAVLLLIGALLTSVRVGWAALWASVVLTAATIWLKPVITRMFAGATKKSASQRTAVGEKVVQYASVFVVELIVWMLVVVFSGVDVRGWFWGYLLPPLFLLIAWMIYDVVDDRIEARAGSLYDRARNRGGAPAAGVTTAEAAPPVSRDARQEASDGLTPEQRRMLDELG
ncbi:MAG: hypothetical protein EOO67_01180 [Microbacterium sp.]|nr:MAG: hypothetical protein EOO67_01180 [Microbacterium sp.]